MTDSGLDSLRQRPGFRRPLPVQPAGERRDDRQHVPHQLRLLRNVQIFIHTGDSRPDAERRRYHFPYKPSTEPGQTLLMLDQRYRHLRPSVRRQRPPQARGWPDRRSNVEELPHDRPSRRGFPQRAICRSSRPRNAAAARTLTRTAAPSTSGSFPAPARRASSSTTEEDALAARRPTVDPIRPDPHATAHAARSTGWAGHDGDGARRLRSQRRDWPPHACEARERGESKWRTQ